MRKNFFLLVFLSCFIDLFSQTAIQFPETEKFELYINQRTKNIIESIYTLALNNQIKAYQNDSFNSYFSPHYLQLRGSSTFPNSDSIAYLKKEDLAGFYFVKAIEPSKRDETVQYSIVGVAPLFTISYGGYSYGRERLFMAKLSEVKKHLPESDYQFLIQLGRYASLDNQIKILDEPWSPFQQVNFEKHQYIRIDSAFMAKMAKMLHIGGAYYDIIRFNERYRHPVMLKDVQTGKMIDMEDIRTVYCDSMHLVVPASNNIPEHDTVICSYFDFRYADSIVYDKNGKVDYLTIHVERAKTNAYGWVVGYNNPCFRIGTDIYRREDAGKTMLWYYEDYLKWKSNQQNVKH